MMTPVASAPSSWVTSTTVSRKFGSGIPGLATRKSVLEEPCAEAVVARTRSARSAARRESFIGRSFPRGTLVLGERDGKVQARGRPGGHRPRPQQQLLPQPRRVLAENEV